MKRKQNGTTIAELGPAMIIVVTMVLIPLTDLIYLGTAFSATWFLNSLEAREVSVRASDQSSQAIKDTESQFKGSPAAKLLGLSVGSKSNCSARVIEDADGMLVTVETVVEVTPLLTAPIPIQIAGLTAPATLCLSSTMPRQTR